MKFQRRKRIVDEEKEKKNPEEKSLLEKNLLLHYDEVDERLKEFSPEGKGAFLEGLVVAFDAMHRLAPSVPVLTPMERERFVAVAKSNAYSTACHLGLDSLNMKFLVEQDREFMREAFARALATQLVLGLPLTYDDLHILINMGLPSPLLDGEDEG